jgi:hypothetical protein
VTFAEEVVLTSAENLEESWQQLSVDEHLSIVYSLQRSGKYDEAEQRLNYLLSEDASSPFLRFEQAKNSEYKEEYLLAIDDYQDLLEEKLTSDLKLNVRYRYCLVLSNLGEHKKANKMARRLRRNISLSTTDRRAVSLVLGTTQLQSGKKAKGIARIQKTLEKLSSPEEHSWLQSRAKMALAEELLLQAAKVELIPSRDLNDSLKERADLIIQAERQVQSIIALNEPEYALKGLSKVADAMLVLYDDLISAQAPSAFTKEQKELYQEQIIEQAEFLKEKALSYYSTALRYANQLKWSGSIRGELEAKYNALQAEI